MRELFLVESGILGFGIWNTAQGIRNPNNDGNFFKSCRSHDGEFVIKGLPWGGEFLTYKFSYFLLLIKTLCGTVK